jgi:phosphonate transport system substrate-binding protein
MASQPLRFASFLAPNLFSVYDFLVRYIGSRLDLPTCFFAGESYSRAAEADVAFLCGLAYIELSRQVGPLFEPIAAPVIDGKRYRGLPIYFSDVIVRRDSSIRCFADLRGRSWSYNEPWSQSGYGITRFHLACLGETSGFFGRVVEAGFHERSITLVYSGEVDASAIDSHVLAIAFRERAALKRELRVISSLGPSMIQPVVVSRRLPESLREDLRLILLNLHRDNAARPALARALLSRFVPVDDSSYDDMRAMVATCEGMGFATLR